MQDTPETPDSGDREELDRIRELVGQARDTLQRWLTEPVEEIDTEEAQALLDALTQGVPSASDFVDGDADVEDGDGDDVDHDELRAA